MNAQRRVEANEVNEALEALLLRIECLIDDEQSALEGIPENMYQRVERGEDTKSHLEDAKTSVEEAIGHLESAVDR